MLFTNIPIELRNLPHWVLWRLEHRNGQQTKVPYQINGYHANVTKLMTQTRFDIVCQAYANGDYNGIGYVFSANDPYTGIDIDGCVIDGQLTEEAAYLVNQFSSYTEYSQSGKGIHIIIQANKLGQNSRKGNIEIYDRNRFFVMTGNHLAGTPTLITKCQQTLDTLCNSLFSRTGPLSGKEIIKLAAHAKNGKKFTELYRGKIEAYGNDKSAADLAFCSILAFWTKNPMQIDCIFRSSGLMRDKWNRLDYRERTITKALENTLALKRTSTTEVLKEKKAVHTSSIPDFDGYALTDLGNSKRFINQCGHLCRFVHPFRTWYLWNGFYWEKDQNGGIIRLAKQVAENISQQAKDGPAPLVQHARKVESYAAMKNMITLSESELHINLGELDKHPWLLNVRNGTLCLKTGTLMTANKEHCLTRQADVTFDSEATSPLWTAFLHQIMNGNVDLIRFLQKAIGYSLTGSVHEQIIFFLYGEGQNGKSTFLSIIAKLMGSYAKTLLASSLMVKKHDGINNDIAGLQGIRFVVTSEGEQNQHLAEALIKLLTGGDKRKARFLFEEYFEYEPTDKIWFMTNHKPIIKGKDHGIWRRIMLIPFSATISTEKQDKTLKQKLLDELPGILNWALKGCLLYQQEGFIPPAEVFAANEAYHSEMDSVQKFISECCEAGCQLKVKQRKLYMSYLEWCSSHGVIALNCKRLQQELREQGYSCRNANQNQIYVFGLKLKD